MDALVAQAEEIVLTQEGVRDVFAFAGDGGLNNNTGGVSAPGDTIGQIQIDLEPWGERPDGNVILDQLPPGFPSCPVSRPRSLRPRKAPVKASPSTCACPPTTGRTCWPPPPSRARISTSSRA
jgi:multidrug efflux pump